MAYAHAETYKFEGVTVCKFQDTVFQDIPSVSKCFLCVCSRLLRIAFLWEHPIFIFLSEEHWLSNPRDQLTPKNTVDDMMIKQFSNLKRKNKRMQFKQYPNK